MHKAWKSLEKKKQLLQTDGIYLYFLSLWFTYNPIQCSVEDAISGAVVDELSQEDPHESYCPLTLELQINTVDELLKQVQTLSDGKFDPLKPFCITGLHTCGDLAANVLRLFLQSPTARAVCVVGCCYHQISESGGIGRKF